LSLSFSLFCLFYSLPPDSPAHYIPPIFLLFSQLVKEPEQQARRGQIGKVVYVESSRERTASRRLVSHHAKF
jgi:hypothetical protein